MRGESSPLLLTPRLSTLTQSAPVLADPSVAALADRDALSSGEGPLRVNGIAKSMSTPGLETSDLTRDRLLRGAYRYLSR